MTTEAQAHPGSDASGPPRRRARPFWRAVLGSPSGAIGVTLVAAHLLVALSAPLLVPYDYAAQDSASMLQPPSTVHWFGTDMLGRDVLTRTLLGGREAMFICTLATAFAMLWGSMLGISLALVGGWTDNIVMRCADALMAMPWILFVMIFVAALGTGTAALIPILSISYGLSVVYLARSATLDFVTRDFVLAAKVRGERRSTIVLKELLPNVRDSLAVQAAMQWSWMILGVSSLSYLGLGVPPPAPYWGLMVADARGIMAVAPWTAIFPILALSSLIIGANLAVDAVAKARGIDRDKARPAR
jgi:peptide/nickel transport system permease protein